jgi:hypothetical protein
LLTPLDHEEESNLVIKESRAFSDKIYTYKVKENVHKSPLLVFNYGGA